MNTLSQWLKNKLGITDLELQVKQQQFKITDQEKSLNCLYDELKKYERLDADIGLYERGNNTIVLTGVFRGRAYVQFYDVGMQEFEQTVRIMKDKHKHALIRHVDAPTGFASAFNL